MGCVPQFAADWCFFLDLDGTLVDISERPALVRIDAALQDLLRRLMAITGGAVALISGRSIVDIDRLFSPLQLPAAGQHGLERRDTLGTVHVFNGEAAPLQPAALELERRVAPYPGLELERKGMTLALHYRRAPHLEPMAASVMHDILGTLGDGFELLRGKMLFEVKPRGKDKGTAIADFMREAPFKARIPVYIGDDVTDECGFAQVNQMRGHTLKVGAGATRAQWRLADAAAVRAWLTTFVDRYSPPPSSPSLSKPRPL
jgi:trehalose 6-phosphate phosphatase